MAGSMVGVHTLWERYAGGRRAAGDELADLLVGQGWVADWAGVRVLDLGCGDGGVGEALVRRRASVTGVDLSAERRRAAAGRGLVVVGADAHRLPFRCDSFDVVVAYDLLEHVRRPADVLREVAAVLRPGGLVYVTVPNRLSVVNLLADPHYNVPAVGVLPRAVGAWCVTRLLRLAPSYTVERYFTWWGATRLFRRAGFGWQELPGGWARKLAAGATPTAPARRWMARVAGRGPLRAVVRRAGRTRLFLRLIAPSWRFLLFRIPAGSGALGAGPRGA